MLFDLDNGKKNKNKNLNRLIKYVYRWEFKKNTVLLRHLSPPSVYSMVGRKPIHPEI